MDGRSSFLRSRHDRRADTLPARPGAARPAGGDGHRLRRDRPPGRLLPPRRLAAVHPRRPGRGRGPAPAVLAGRTGRAPRRCRRRPGRLPHRSPPRSAGLQPSRVALVLPVPRRAGRGVLRPARTPGRRPRTLPARRTHLHPGRRGRRPDAPRPVHRLQRGGGPGLDLRTAGGRVLPRRGPAGRRPCRDRRDRDGGPVPGACGGRPRPAPGHPRRARLRRRGYAVARSRLAGRLWVRSA